MNMTVEPPEVAAAHRQLLGILFVPIPLIIILVPLPTNLIEFGCIINGMMKGTHIQCVKIIILTNVK